MIRQIPACFRSFQCIASRCPDTCCAGWEIDLDEEILERYRQVPGELGCRIREKLCQKDGFTGFSLENGRCPFLNEENLCRLILELGEEALSVTCREHPRFLEEYGELQETCLAISCPEAARLLLTEGFSLHAVTTEEPSPVEEDLDEALLRELCGFRSRLFALAAGPLWEHIPIIIEETCQMQAELDARCFGIEGGPTPPPKWNLSGFFRTVEDMEFTSPRLPNLLKKLPEAFDLQELFSREEERAGTLMCYFLYRYVLRAVWNGDLIDKVLFAVYATAAILAMATVTEGEDPLTEAAILFSREVEHSDGNLDLLLGYLIDISA